MGACFLPEPPMPRTVPLDLVDATLNHASDKARRSVARILDAATRVFGTRGYEGATMGAVAEEAGVSKGLLHYHFKSKHHLLIEAQRAVLRQIHKRFLAQAQRGDRGLTSALSGIDALWQAVTELQSHAPFMVEVMSISAHDGPARDPFRSYAEECTTMLQDGIEHVFTEEELGQLVVPPDRIAFLVRVALQGLIVELAQAREPAERERVAQAYSDFRDQFARMVLLQPGEILF